MKDCKGHSLIGLAAIRAGKSGSFRAWIIARYMNDGSGRFLKARLYQEIEKVTSKRNRQRWIKEALELGIFTRSRCGNYFRYISVEKAAAVYQARDIVAPTWTDPDDLVKPGWHGLYLAGYYESRNPDQPISRAALATITGLQKQTQINLEKGNDHIVKHECKAVLGKVSDPEKAFKELQNNPDPSVRIQGNKIIKQLPYTYTTQGIKQAKKGSTRNYRNLLNISLTKSQRDPDNKIRIYFKNPKQALKNSRKYSQVKYCFIRQDSAGINWFSEVNFN